jgi:hypothetical protein
MDPDTDLIAAWEAAGYQPIDDPFFRHRPRDLDDTQPQLGYRTRVIRDGELAARAAGHRTVWLPGSRPHPPYRR